MAAGGLPLRPKVGRRWCRRALPPTIRVGAPHFPRVASTASSKPSRRGPGEPVKLLPDLHNKHHNSYWYWEQWWLGSVESCLFCATHTARPYTKQKFSVWLFFCFFFERIVRMSNLVQKMVADIKSIFIPAAFLEEVRPSRASEPNWNRLHLLLSWSRLTQAKHSNDTQTGACDTLLARPDNTSGQHASSSCSKPSRNGGR